MRKFKFEQVNSTPYKGLDGTVIFHDGTDPTHKILLEKVDGLGIPQSIVQTQQAPFQVGASPIRVTYGPRTISFECAIIVDCKTDAGKATMESIKRDLGNKFSPVGMGYVPQTSLTGSAYSTITGKLSYASDGTNYDRFIDCVPISCEFPNRAYSDGFQRFRLALFCPDPTWYGAEQSSAMSSVSVGISGQWKSIAWSPELGIFCAIATGSNAIQTSPDGFTWTARTGAVSDLWFDIAWSPSLGIFCAVSITGPIQTSPDGITWTLRTGAATGSRNIAWSPELGIFCAVLNGSDQIQTSPDGINWTLRTGVSSANWREIEWSPQLRLFCVVAISTNSIQTSPDGINWTLRTGAASADWFSITWSKELGIFCAIANNSNSIQTSPDGINWTLRTGTGSGNWTTVEWSPELGIFCAAKYGSTDIQTSLDGTTWTARTGASANNWWYMAWSPQLGAFCVVADTASQYPQISYDGSNWFQPAVTDYFEEITNDGDVPAEFEIDIPVAGGETSKVIAIGDNFLWSGTGTPPSDHNLVFGTDGLKKGIVTVSTTFNDKDIRQFGVSKFNLYQQGTFFSLYVSGATTNNIYVRNTGTNAGAPTIRWKNRYLGV